MLCILLIFTLLFLHNVRIVVVPKRLSVYIIFLLCTSIFVKLPSAGVVIVNKKKKKNIHGIHLVPRLEKLTIFYFNSLS